MIGKDFWNGNLTMNFICSHTQNLSYSLWISLATCIFILYSKLNIFYFINWQRSLIKMNWKLGVKVKFFTGYLSSKDKVFCDFQWGVKCLWQIFWHADLQFTFWDFFRFCTFFKGFGNNLFTWLAWS